MSYTSIFKTKKERPAEQTGYVSIFGKEQQPEPKSKVFTFPEHLGGGQYSDVKTKRGYAGLSTKEQQERDHIFSVFAGGTSNIENLQYLPTDKRGRQAGKVKVELEAYNKYKKGEITVEQARLMIATEQQKIKGLIPKQGTKAYLWEGVKETASDVGGFFKRKFLKPLKEEYQERKNKTKEEKDKEYATRSLAGYEGRTAKKEEIAKMEAGTSVTSYKDLAELTEKTAEEQETISKAFVIPVRYTAGELAKAMTSYSLEKANSEAVYEQKTDTQKLFLGEEKIRRLTKQEDMYGMIARGVGIPAAVITMAVMENPFLASIGIPTAIKNVIKKKMTKEAGEMVIKLGAKELSKIADNAIKESLKVGKITKKEAIKATTEMAKMKKPKPPIKKISEIKPTTKVIPDKLTEQAKKYKSAEEFVEKYKQNNIVHNETKYGGNLKYKDGSLAYSYDDGNLVIDNIEVKIQKKGTGNALMQEIEKIAQKKGKKEIELNAYPQDKTITSENLIKFYDDLGYEVNATMDMMGETSADMSKSVSTMSEPISKTKSQLKDIWNKEKAGEIKPTTSKIKPTIKKVTRDQLPVGEGVEKISRLEARTRDILKKVTPEEVDDLGLATYKQVNNKDNIAKASEYVIKNTDEAMEVLKGNVQAPKGILNNSIYVAMDNLAKGDITLATKLASLKSTRFGQEISVLRELNPNSPVRKIEEIIKIREKAITKKLKGKSIKKVKKEITKDIKKIIKTPNKDSWQNFIKKIQC